MSAVECTTNAEDACDLTTPGSDVVAEQNSEKNSKTELENEEKQNVDFTELNDQERLLLYEKGVQKQSTRHALHCLLGCLQGLKDGSKFPMLPDCLKHIADIYVKEGDYESAISFVQAEKLYYETALISVGSDVEEVQQDSDQKSTKKPELHKNGGENSQDVSSLPEQEEKPGNEESAGSELVKKADEYEKLSHLCLKQKNIQLALEYCGKAVKLRQSHFGENHPITTKSLNLFTVIYAEMGKEQYTAAMKKFSEVTESAKDANKESSSVEAENQSQVDSHPGPSSEVGGNQDTSSGRPMNRETRTTDENAAENNKDGFAEETRSGEDVDGGQEASQSRPVDRTLIWFFVLAVIMGVLVAVLLKYASRRDLQAMYRYTVTRIKYFYYFHFRQAQKGDKFF